MESVALLTLLFLVVCASSQELWSNPRRRTKLPPGPYRYPIVRNILQLSWNPHRSLANLSKTYGPLMSLHLGSRNALIVSSPEITKQVLRDLIIARVDSTSTKMAFARNELKTVIGEDKAVEESDIPKLPYLQAVIKETFQCHPAHPVLVLHKAKEDVEINGFTILKNSQILVNIWAMSRDPSIWSEQASFEPESFLDSKVNFKERDFALIPCGLGRRICPGLPLADRIIHLSVATLIHDFDWKIELGNTL